MSLFLASVAFPLVLAALALGHGLLIARLAGGGVPGTLLLPLGLAGIVVASQLTTYWDWSAELTTPLVVVLALGGFVVGWSWLRALKPDPWAVAAAVGVFATLVAPVVVSGEATFAGYGVLGDTSIHFIGADHLLENGRNLEGLEPSSYEFSLAQYHGLSSYPAGGPTAIGAVRPLVAQDVAWIFQPFLAFVIATMALALYSLLTPVVSSAALRALIAFTAAQPALVYAYALQGSIKEIGTAWGIPLLAALLPVFGAQRGAAVRAAIPLAVAGAATVGFVGVAAGVWIAPVALAALVLSALANRHRLRSTVFAAATFMVLLLVLSFQSFIHFNSYVDIAGGVVTAQNEFGNLLGPLRNIQMFGIWLTGDYRLPPTGGNYDVTLALIGVSVVAGVLGLIWAWRSRAWAPVLLLVISVLGWWYVTRSGSPWADGKALVIVSPAIVMTAMLGSVAIMSFGRRLEAFLLAGIIAGGVLASNALAYHDVSLAPRARLGELEAVGKRIDGEGPTLYTEFEEFGKHFLRRGDPEGSSEGWQRRLGPLRNGQFARMGFGYGVDDFPLEYVRYYRTIVLRKSPTASRPPSNYTRTFSGGFYEVWQREPGSESSVIEHLSLGSLLDRGAVPSCGEVMRLGRAAQREGARLVYSPAPRTYSILPTESAFPPNWFVDPTEGHILRPRGPGRIQDSTVIRVPSTYDVWIMGSFARGYDVFVDGRPVGDAKKHLNGRGQFAHVAGVELDPGRHIITLVRGGGSLAPGDGVLEMLGPIVLVERIPDPYGTRTVEPRQARSLCGRRLDWLEVVR